MTSESLEIDMIRNLTDKEFIALPVCYFVLVSDSGEIDRDEMRECIEICTKESNLGENYSQTRTYILPDLL